MHKVTINDIANAAGVSVGTVSKVLNGDQTVKERNRLAVQNAIQTLGYNVNQAARRLARGPICLGIMLPNVFDAYFDSMEAGILRVIRSLSDYRVSAVVRRYAKFDDDQSVSRCLSDFMENHVDGILLGPLRSIQENSPVLSLLHASRLPVVLLLSDLPQLPRLSCVSIDAVLSGQTAADLAVLSTPPDRHFTVLVGNKDVAEHRIKAESFQKRIAEYGRHAVRVLETQDDPGLAYMLSCNLIRDNPNLGLIYVATGNSVAVCKAICDCGKADSVKVIATDLPDGLMPYVDRSVILGVLDQHLDEIGSRAAFALYQHLVDGTACTDEISIPPSLLLRSSIKSRSTGK